MTTPEGYSLDQLAEKSGLEPRTIRNYVSKGLLPRPSRGRGAQYEPRTLDRLLAIKRLIDETGCSLDYCRTLLDTFEDDYIAAIASGREQIRVVDPAHTATMSCRYLQLACIDMEEDASSRIRLKDGDTWIRVPISEDVILSIRSVPQHLNQAKAEHILNLVREIVDGSQAT